MDKIKKAIIFISILISAFAIYLYVDDNNIISIIKDYYQKEQTLIVKNNYTYDIGNNFVKMTDDYSPNKRQDILDIFYTVIASGMNNFTFYCDKNYKDCIKDIEDIMQDSSLLSHINNFVPIFNSYDKLKITYTQSGRITLIITKAYNKEKIELVSSKIDELYPTLVSSTKSTTSNIKSIHDYIINNAKYDSDYDVNNPTNDSNNAYGILYNGKGVCTGYTDLMSLFLYKMGVINHKISNGSHVWNYVYIDDKWLHLDVTWDDPVASDGKNYLRDEYFLITTEELKNQDVKVSSQKHIYDTNIYEH